MTGRPGTPVKDVLRPSDTWSGPWQYAEVHEGRVEKGRCPGGRDRPCRDPQCCRARCIPGTGGRSPCPGVPTPSHSVHKRQSLHHVSCQLLQMKRWAVISSQRHSFTRPGASRTYERTRVSSTTREVRGRTGHNLFPGSLVPNLTC